MKRVKPVAFISVLCALVAVLCAPVVAQEIPRTPISDIVFVVDCSGSVQTTDSHRYIQDALLLAVDLAPSRSQIGIVSVSDRVLSELPLTDLSDAAGRAAAKSHIRAIETGGNTNFTPGLERALELLTSSTAAQKRIVFLGDFMEGGANTAGNSVQAADLIDQLADRAKSAGIQIDLLLAKESPAGSLTAPRYQAMAGTTGGTLYALPGTDSFPSSVEDIYFKNYPYLKTVYSLRGDASQALHIPLPTDQVQRARIYISATKPVKSAGSVYQGSALEGESTKSYTMLDIDKPSREGIEVTVTPGASDSALVYLLLDYDLRLEARVESQVTQLERGKEQAQTSAIRLDIVDSQTGTPLLPSGESVFRELLVTGPGGQQVVHGELSQESGSFVFMPDPDTGFGTYQVQVSLSAGDFVIGPFNETVVVDDIRQAPKPNLFPLYTAIVIAACLIAGATMIAYRHKKKESEFQGAVEMSSDYRFHGKLSIYAVMLEGGNREIRPFDFGLHLLNEKRVTLRDILDSVGAKDTYVGSENILFLVGPEESIVVRNNAQAVIKMMSRTYDNRSKLQLFYGQKIYIIFEKDENELEISYRKVKTEDPDTVQFNISSRQTRV